VLLALSMMVGSNSITPLISTWVHQLLPNQPTVATKTIGHAFMLYSSVALVGYVGVIWLCNRLSRRSAYATVVFGASAAALVLFTQVTTVEGLFWSLPLYSVFDTAGFGFFAAYFPELFPTPMRAEDKAPFHPDGPTLLVHRGDLA
jgi:hypothetical protein